MSEIEDQLNEIKQKARLEKKSAKRNEQSLQEMWDYAKRPNLHFLVYLKVMGRIEPS